MRACAGAPAARQGLVWGSSEGRRQEKGQPSPPRTAGLPRLAGSRVGLNRRPYGDSPDKARSPIVDGVGGRGWFKHPRPSRNME